MKYSWLILSLLFAFPLRGQDLPNHQELPRDREIDPQVAYAYLVGDSIFFTDKNYKTGNQYYGKITAILGLDKGRLTVEINNGNKVNGIDYTETHTFYQDELEKEYSLLYYWVLDRKLRELKDHYLGRTLIIKEGRYYLPRYKRFFDFDPGDTIQVNNLIYDKRASTTEKHENILELGFFFSAVYRNDTIYLSPEYVARHSIDFQEFTEQMDAYDRESEAFFRAVESRYGSQSAQKIVNGEYWLGMRKEEAYLSLGKPPQISKTYTYWIFYETWKYPNMWFDFQNGMLMGWKPK